MQTRQIISDALSVVSSQPDLSAPAAVLAMTAAGAAVPIIDIGPSIGEKVIGEAIGQAVGEIASAVPVVGFFVTIATSIIKLVGATAEQREAERRAACQTAFQLRRVLPSGSKLGGCETCPCDIFRVVNYGAWSGRSLLGQALIAITEGGEMGPVLPLASTATFGPWWKHRYDMIGAAAGTKLTEEERLRYRRLRVAMEAAYVEPGENTSSDAGVSFWPAYLDGLLRDIDRGRITTEYADLCLSAKFLPKVNGKHVVTTDPRVAQISGLMLSTTAILGSHGALVRDSDDGRCFVPSLRDAVFSLATGWRDSVRPRYDEGKRALAEIQAVANQMRNAQGGLLAGLSPRPSLGRFLFGTAAVGALGVAVVKPALALGAARSAAGIVRRLVGAIRR